MSQWVRLWDDMPDDPKWRVIAKRSGRPLHQVIAVFTRMLVNASRSSERGTLEGWVDEDEAIALDMEEDDVRSIREAMQGKVLEGEFLSGWDKRQPKREDNSSERVKALRERRNDVKRDVTQRNAPEERRVEEIRIEASPLVDAEPSTPHENVVSIDRKRNPERATTIRRIGEWWNDLASSLSLKQIDRIEARRETAALSRAKRLVEDFGTLEAGLIAIEAKIRGSPFLQGCKGWRGVTFDWLMKAENFQKILEGNYDDEVRQERRR